MIAQRLSARRLVGMLGDWRGSGHSYVELADSIWLLVRDGGVPLGTALPAERQLAEALAVSRTTVSAAYQRLREQGVAQSKQGSGTVVRAQRRQAGAAESADDAEIDLSAACPSPWHGLEGLANAAVARQPELFREIGFDTIGRQSLRERIAARYTERGLHTTADQIMVTLGAQHAVFLIARTLLRRGDRTLIESPSYPHAREALTATGALVAELPVWQNARAGERAEASAYNAASILDIARRTSPRLAYLIPDHHNPTGQSMPGELRAELIATLTAQGTHIIADETTAELALGGTRMALPFAAAASQAHQQDFVITVGSLGKTVWGGLRIGWIRATPELIARLETSRRVGDLGTGSWEQLLAELALDRYDEILADRSIELTERHRVLSEQLGAHLPEWTMSPVVGGACTWVDLGGPASTRLSRDAAQLGVWLPPGSRFGSPGVFERFARVPFTAEPAVLTEAVARLRLAWDSGVGSATASHDTAGGRTAGGMFGGDALAAVI
ncbi:MocR-like transcription factor YczR [Leucobacter aridicollis]|uniref:MocR-like transcription factor YczR n=1 Tax=Leucobacter aridicollis TaxID=283878 RepID=UPI000E649597|nr:PLP-dependent aminotransferase family protein [Leucobacter aridicollis]UTX52325.1 PLP-dependent aminotransferase family protein [Leucobacter aridicollis]